MSVQTNAFEEAAAALAEVRQLVVRGDTLARDLSALAKAADVSASRAVERLTAEIAFFRRNADEALQRFRAAAESVAGGASSVTERLEASAAQIRAEAVKAVAEVSDRSAVAVKRVVAEVTIAQDRFEKAAGEMSRSSETAAVKIVEVGRAVEAEVASHRARLSEVQEALVLAASRYDSATKALVEARKEVEEAQRKTEAATERVEHLEAEMRGRLSRLLIAALAVLVVSIGFVAWAFVGRG